MKTHGRIVTLLRDYEGHGLSFKGGGQYVVEDPTLGHLLMMGVAGPVREREVSAQDGPKVLLTRSGGFGDVLFMTPILRTLVAAGKDVTVCCHEKYREALSGVPVAWKRYPMTVMETLPYDREIWLEGVIEFAEDPQRHAVDLMAEAAGVTLTEGKELSFAVREEDREWAARRFPKCWRKRVGVQLVASSPARTYPKELMVEVIRALLDDEGVEVALFGAPGTVELEVAHDRVLNVAARAKTFGESAAVLVDCDAVLAPDSAITHLAGALRLPTVALYGPFPWGARTAYAPTIRALSGSLRCAPCYWHGRGAAFPPHGPCSITGKCEAMAMIEPERVVREVRRLMA
jgi:ADP-heptose:LPS heptosyltransferase